MAEFDLFGDPIIFRGRGRPKHVPTRQSTCLAHQLAQAGRPHIEIARALGLSDKRLKRYYAAVIGPGRPGRRPRAHFASSGPGEP